MLIQHLKKKNLIEIFFHTFHCTLWFLSSGSLSLHQCLLKILTQTISSWCQGRTGWAVIWHLFLHVPSRVCRQAERAVPFNPSSLLASPHQTVTRGCCCHAHSCLTKSLPQMTSLNDQVSCLLRVRTFALLHIALRCNSIMEPGVRQY